MTLFLFIKQAISSIWANKLRSFLSTLGIVIGISSFVIMLAIGEGAKQNILKDIGAAGNIINVSNSFGSDSSDDEKDIFTEQIANQIEKKVPFIKKVIVKYAGPTGEMTYKSKNINGEIEAISMDYLQFKDAKLAYGSYFNSKDYNSGEKFVILGNGFIKKSEWGESSPMVGTIPIGEKINTSGENFIIIGIIKEKNWNFDNKIFIGLPTAKKIFNNVKVVSFEVSAENEKVVEQAQKYLNYFLIKKAGLKKGAKTSFSVRTNKESLKQINEMSQKFTLLLAGIGAIALIVGGIGIMNIMVVSVTERTREIGIRKAIGATNKNILFQFLIESVILTLFGSILAIAFSQGIVTIIGNLIPDFTPVINSYVLFIATGVSVSMGIIFGIMPAYKAAKLKPIDALHFE